MLRDKLITMKACPQAIAWVGKKQLKSAWATCERGDWMLWFAGGLEVDRKLIVLAGCDCAEIALQYVPTPEDRPAKVIQVTRYWCEGRVSIEDVRKARHAAASACDAAYSACAAAYSAYCAAATAAAKAAAYSAATAAAATAYVYAATAYVSNAAAYSTADAAYSISRKQHAKLIRKRIPYNVIKQAMS